MQPKIYKQSNRGRPVISSVNCHTNFAISWSSFTATRSRKVPTTDKIQKESFLVIMDIRWFYTKIPSNEGIKAVETTLKQKSFSRKVIISFLKLILTFNNFIFNCTNFLQKDVQWEQNESQHMKTSSWVYLRNLAFIH